MTTRSTPPPGPGLTSTEMVKKMDTPTLRQMCDHALRLKFSNGPNGRFWADVDPDGVHVSAHSWYHRPCVEFWESIAHEFDFSHNDGVNIRALVLCKMRGRAEPTCVLCDFDADDFEALPEATPDEVHAAALLAASLRA